VAIGTFIVCTSTSTNGCRAIRYHGKWKRKRKRCAFKYGEWYNSLWDHKKKSGARYDKVNPRRGERIWPYPDPDPAFTRRGIEHGWKSPTPCSFDRAPREAARYTDIPRLPELLLDVSTLCSAALALSMDRGSELRLLAH
jgi:hypothetical protein